MIVLEGHEPVASRVRTGRSPVSGAQRYGTALRCSCGASFGQVSNDPPSSKPARYAVAEAQARHVRAVLDQKGH